MLTRPKRLMVIALLVSVFTLYWGCTQPDDILTDKSQTIIHLEAQRLPDNPEGMVYQLCIAESIVDDSVYRVQTIGTFGYRFETQTYLDENGEIRPDSNCFVFAGDLLKYQWLCITVQRTDGSDVATGPVMLIDTISIPTDDPIELVFPDDTLLWQSIAYYHMKTVTDGPDSMSNTNGSGIWFNTVLEEDGRLQDTIDLVKFVIDTVWRDTLGDDEYRISIVDISNVRCTTVHRGFGLDTLEQEVIRYDVETHIAYADSEPPYLTTDVEFTWEIGTLDSFRFDNHIQIGTEFPDYTKMGWVYKGWVVSSIIEDQGVSTGKITPPAWTSYNTDFNPNDSLIGGIDGGLLTTITFTDIFTPDDSNPHSSDVHIPPPFPGEDFLRNLPGGGVGPVNLVPGGGKSYGTIFITLEPSNAVTDTTNFPLFVMTGELPRYREWVEAVDQSYALWSRVGSTPGLEVGFPRVMVSIQRF